YSEEALAEMLQLASAEALAQALAELELSRGTVSADALEDAQFTTQRYRQASRELVQRRLAGADLDTLLSAWVSSAERDLLRREEEDLAGPSAEELIRNFVGMAQASGEAPSPVAGSAPVSLAQLEAWVVQALAVPAEQEFLQSLESDRAFERASKTLDPVQLDKVRTIAKAIPPMARALEVATQPHIRGLLAAMQEASLRQQVLALLQDPALEQRVRSAKQAQEAQKLKALEAQIPMLRRLDDIGSLDAEALQGLAQTLRQIADQEAIAARSQDPVLKELASVEAHERALHRVEASLRGLQEERRQYRQAVLRLEQILEAVPELDAGLRRSPMAEVKGLLRAFSGGFVEPSVGGDPIQSPEAVPVGRNMYSVDAEKTPTVAAQRVGAQLGQALLDAHRAKHEGAYPQKVAFTLWPGDFIHTEGAVIAELFWLLGVEPIRDAFQRVVSLRPIPAEALGRPRVDVVVQTAGQLRDLAASRLYLIEEAVRLAAAQPEEDNAL
ncbi:MAG: cobaltochelatase subunit CobN, partial [Oceanococcaceae bacterium]